MLAVDVDIALDWWASFEVWVVTPVFVDACLYLPAFCLLSCLLLHALQLFSCPRLVVVHPDAAVLCSTKQSTVLRSKLYYVYHIVSPM